MRKASAISTTLVDASMIGMWAMPYCRGQIVELATAVLLPVGGYALLTGKHGQAACGSYRWGCSSTRCAMPTGTTHRWVPRRSTG